MSDIKTTNISCIYYCIQHYIMACEVLIQIFFIFWVSKTCIGIVVILYMWLYITDSNSFNFNRFFGNFGLYWWVPEGRNMSAIQDEEALYQNLKKISITYIHIIIRYWMAGWFCLSICLSVRYRNHFPVVQFQN